MIGSSKCLDCDVYLCESCVTGHRQETSQHRQGHRIISSIVSAFASNGFFTSALSWAVESPSKDLDDRTLIGDRKGQDSNNNTTYLACSGHGGLSLNLYCIDCETAICHACTEAEHEDHETMATDQAAQTQRDELTKLLDRARKRIATLRRTRTLVERASGDLDLRYCETESRIQNSFAEIASLIQQQKNSLLEQLENAYSGKRKVFQGQLEKVEMLLTETEVCCDFTEKVVEHGNDTEVLLSSKELAEKLTGAIRSDSKGDLTLPREDWYLDFDDADFGVAKKYLKNLNGVRTVRNLSGVEAVLAKEGLKNCWVGKETTLTVQLTGCGDQKATGSSPISAKITLAGGDVWIPEIVEKSSKTVDILFTPSEPGSLTLEILLYGKPIKGSPFQITATKELPNIKLTKLTRNGIRPNTAPCFGRTSSKKSIDNLCRPLDKTARKVPEKGRLEKKRVTIMDVVVETGTNRNCCNRNHTPRVKQSKTEVVRSKPEAFDCVISGSPIQAESPNSMLSDAELKEENDQLAGVKLNDQGVCVRIGCKGREKGNFANIQGLCSSGGQIIAADSNNHCIQTFSSDTGLILQKFGKKGQLPGQLMRPTGVAVMPNGTFVVADYENRCVNLYGPDGRYQDRIGHGKLLGPKGVGVDRQGRIVVVDNKGCCVYFYLANGKLVGQFGSRGYGEGELSGPHFCAFTPNDDIVVTDFHSHCVKVFGADGRPRFSFGSNGDGNGQFRGPTGVAVDRSGNIIVADWGNSRIQV